MAWLKDINEKVAITRFDSWVDELFEEKEEAVEAYKAEKAEEREREREARQQNEQALLARVEALVNDPVFRALTTQRAMYTYAVEKIEGLAELRDTKVKQAIVTLADKVGLRKHTKGG